MGTNSGLIEISPKEPALVQSLSKQDGLIDNEVWFYQSVHLDNSGAVYFGTPKGLSIYRPHVDQKNSVPSEPRFREIRFSQEENGNNDFLIRFSALSFADEKSVRYRWRVVGYRPEWSEPTPISEIRLMNLPAFGLPQNYKVEIHSSNNDGIWSEKPLTYSFDINPAWWLRWQFILFAVSSILALFVIFYQVRVRSIARRARALKVLSDNLQEEVKM